MKTETLSRRCRSRLSQSKKYVKKIIVTGGTHTSYSSWSNKQTFDVSLKNVCSYCLFGCIQDSLNDEITDGVVYFT